MRYYFLFPISLWLGACVSSPQAPSPVMEPADPVAAEEAPIEVKPPPALPKVQAKLAELGYEGIGLELESDEVLEILYAVFKDSAAKGRKIKTIFTGAAMAYEAPAEEVTIGGTSDPKTILAFIKKKIPLRKKK